MRKVMIFCIILSFIFISCQSIEEKDVIISDSSIKDVKNCLVILKTPDYSKISRSNIFKSISSLLSGYEIINEFKFAESYDETLAIYFNNDDSFYQTSEKNKFLEYKSAGTARKFAIDNAEKINSELSANKSEFLMIYEVNPVYSDEMKNMLLSTVFAVYDKNLKLIYFSHQRVFISNTEIDHGKTRQLVLNKISNIFVDFMKNNKFIKGY